MTFFFALWLPVSGRAFAQLVPAPRDGPGIVNVTLRSEKPKQGEKPKVRLAVLPEYPPEDSEVDPPIRVCEGDCSLVLPAGSYRLEVSGPTDSDVRTGTTAFMIDGDSEIAVGPASQKGRSEGLGLAITGTTIAGVATFITLIGLFINSAAECLENCENDTQENRNRHALEIAGVGGAVVLVGAAIATAGWRSFAHTSGPTVKVEPAERKSAAIDSLRLGPVRMHTGWGLGGAMRF